MADECGECVCVGGGTTTEPRVVFTILGMFGFAGH